MLIFCSAAPARAVTLITGRARFEAYQANQEASWSIANGMNLG